MFETDFLTASPESHTAYRDWMARAVGELCQSFLNQPVSGKNAVALSRLFDEGPLRDEPCLPENLWKQLGTLISKSVNVFSPRTMAHLHCPPLIPALAAEVVLSALNQSMDSFDQAPAATVLEEKIVSWLGREVGLGATAGGVFTAGGTQSNYMALLLARDACIERHFNRSVQKRGLPPEAHKLRIFCSEVAHFTVEKSAAQLGLGTDAVIRVAVDDDFRMSVEALRAALAETHERGVIPMAVVGTAGTTDFGSVDPLTEIAALARSAGAWFHVDAAYGSALLFSQRHRSQLRGIERADSISMDFHKLFWQPISCAAFLLRDAGQFRFLEMHADYLNPEAHEGLGIPNLVNRSIATTRRFDALKLWISLQTLGRKKLGEMIDVTIDLAAHAADCIRRHPRLELINQPTMGCVVFRYIPEDSNINPNQFNASLRQRLFDQGLAVIGHTSVRGRQCVKLTCMNPCTSKRQVDELLQLIEDQGDQMARQ